MEERHLKLVRSAKQRSQQAPLCPCGQDNKHNPHFNPFEDTDGKAGYCHTCGKTFLPENKPDVIYKYEPLPKVKQKFVPEPDFGKSMLVDTTISDEKDGIRTLTFYYRNLKGKLTGAKSMDYTWATKKRIKDRHPLHLFLTDSGYYPCLFNEHALTRHPDAIVILVESEKTAAFMTYRFKDQSEFVFVATGGAGGLSDEKALALKGRTVWICYDCDNGTPQEDGTVLKPKGREGAQTAYLKLVAMCTVRVVDINPELTDGTDLADLPKETVTLDFLRSLPETTRRVPQELIDTLRQLNRDGRNLTSEMADELGQTYSINFTRIVDLNRTIIEQWKKEFGISRAPINERIKHWLSSRYEFRKNILTGLITMRRKGGPWESVNTATLWDEINCNAKDLGKKKGGGDISIARATIENLIESAYVPEFEPIQAYFDSLPPWDGQTDHISILANHITTDDQDFWVNQFKMALIRSIACWRGDLVNRNIMTLIGEEEESGKSTFIRFLCPPELKEYYKEDPLAIHEKDSQIALAENFIWNLEELDELDKKQVSSMKAIISMESTKQRRAYARHEVKMRRIVNFWASTNKNDILSDIKNTRWLCFNVLKVSHDYNNTATGVKKVDINQVWAQAWALYQQNTRYTLDSAERQRRDATNKIFQSMPEEKQLIMRHFKVTDKDDPTAQFMTNLDIRRSIDEFAGPKTRLNEFNIGRSMKQLGFAPGMRRINGKVSRGFYVLYSKIGYAYDDEPKTTETALELPF